ncbi:LysR family transcriptional regulator ArgP [Xinfangfangia sp. D13-10-4-6]|uniref:LysR family transcriptional regulator ArgP n=1 Tax=Pseudogemmobacter hezensis TaxID=2737662 RepID=UPI0015518D1E|nr:LysR family transcriptional regulator ArgP [Pseudogemmobacter hezensis]NPD14044.1 LysR family transcriptional regulator ArgP [Pseudogemmobacter hezensis]
MLDPNWLAALSAIHRRGSFELAAADLSVTQSAVSQRIRALEERVGLRLIRRGQPCTATPEGLRLIRHFDEITLLESQLGNELPALRSGSAPLRIAVNADSLASWVLPALSACEGFLFDLVIDDQDVSQAWLRRGEVMAAITSQPGPLQGCETVALGALRYLATASPDFARRWFAGGIRADTLSHALSLVYSAQDRLQQNWAERIAASEPTPQRVVLRSHLIASSQAFIDATLLGLGWAMNPEHMARPHIEAGRMQVLRPDVVLDVPLYWQFPRLVGPALAPLTAEIRKAAAAVLIPTSESAPER